MYTFQYYIAKLPNFFTYCTQAYAPESYTEEDDYKHGNTIRLGAENTIRWRYKRNEMGEEVIYIYFYQFELYFNRIRIID